MHNHTFIKGQSASVLTCHCGAFRFTDEYLKKSPPIVGVEITQGQALDILKAVKAQLGRNYKSAIRQAWMDGNYDGQCLGQWSAPLQRIRNSFGPTWLSRAVPG